MNSRNTLFTWLFLIVTSTSSAFAAQSPLRTEDGSLSPRQFAKCVGENANLFVEVNGSRLTASLNSISVTLHCTGRIETSGVHLVCNGVTESDQSILGFVDAEARKSGTFEVRGFGSNQNLTVNCAF